VSSGQPEQEIVNIAKQEQADLIVIATHGQRGWRRFLFGSVAEKVVRWAERPVLVIHGPFEGEEEKKVFVKNQARLGGPYSSEKG